MLCFCVVVLCSFKVVSKTLVSNHSSNSSWNSVHEIQYKSHFYTQMTQITQWSFKQCMELGITHHSVDINIWAIPIYTRIVSPHAKYWPLLNPKNIKTDTKLLKSIQKQLKSIQILSQQINLVVMHYLRQQITPKAHALTVS